MEVAQNHMSRLTTPYIDLVPCRKLGDDFCSIVHVHCACNKVLNYMSHSGGGEFT